ncbi:RodZ domain-containing protein, partial [Tritonibacter sp. SIMBA_163]
EEALTLRTGNAGGVVVEYNQQSPTVLGNIGEVKEVTYFPED